VGGGSAIDTAKAVNLYTTYPADDFLDYVNPPIGKGLPIPGPLKPLIAIPTTAGTGSETTGVSIFDDTRLHAKTGIANRRLKPTLGLLDPDNTRTMPPEVAASSGLDLLSHAIQSFTAMPFTGRPRPDRPALRPGLPGLEPDQRRLVDAGAPHGCRLHRPRVSRSVGRRGAGADDAGSRLRRREYPQITQMTQIDRPWIVPRSGNFNKRPLFT
jgi:alcohol dehydrogenase class IV